MVGGSQRRVHSLYQRAHPAVPAADAEPSELSETRMRRRSNRRTREPLPPTSSPVGDEETHGNEEEHVR